MPLPDMAACCKTPTPEEIVKLTPVPAEREFGSAALSAPASDGQATGPNDLKDALRDLATIVRNENSAAAKRHREVLARLQEQQSDLKQDMSELRLMTASCVAEAFGKLPQDLISFSPVREDLASPSPELKPIAEVSTSVGVSSSVSSAVRFEVQTDEDDADAAVRDPSSPTTKSLSKKSALHLKKQGEGLDWTGKGHLALSIVNHDRFEAIIGALIFANSFIMCFEVQYKGLQVGFDLKYSSCKADAPSVWPAAEIIFEIFDWLFGILFFGECALKITVFKIRYFCNAWNYVDFVVVLAFVVDKAAAAMMPVDKEIIQLLRLFRLVRLIRLLRTLEGLDVLYIMTTAIKGMSEILMFAVLLLSVMLMTIALFLTQILHATYFNEAMAGNLSMAELEKKQKLYEYFGSFTRCLLSMFELTLANWPPVTRLLQEEISEWFMPLCLLHKLSIGFAVIGVINGVILQETFKVASTDDMIMFRQKKRASDILRKKMTLLFEALDHSGDGTLDYDEFETISHVPEVKTWLASMDIETDDLRTLFTLIDYEKAGTITVDRLITRIARIKGAARSIDCLHIAEILDSGQVKRNVTQTHGN